MVTTKTSRKDDTYKHMKGVTLVELLTVLTILSLSAGLAGTWFKHAVPSLALRSATTTLENDLKQARSYSLKHNARIILTSGSKGYEVKSLNIKRQWQRGVSVTWLETMPIEFSSGRVLTTGTISLKTEKSQMDLFIEPFTGRIKRHAS